MRLQEERKNGGKCLASNTKYSKRSSKIPSATRIHALNVIVLIIIALFDIDFLVKHFLALRRWEGEEEFYL